MYYSWGLFLLGEIDLSQDIDNYSIHWFIWDVHVITPQYTNVNHDLYEMYM